MENEEVFEQLFHFCVKSNKMFQNTYCKKNTEKKSSVLKDITVTSATAGGEIEGKAQFFPTEPTRISSIL